MKKRYVFLFAAMVLVIGLTGCAGSSAEKVDLAVGESSQKISRDEAKNIAFDTAGVVAEDVSRLTVELDYDDDARRWEYEVDFYADGAEYDIEIDANTGEIVNDSVEKEQEKEPAASILVPTQTVESAPTTATRNLISRDEAKALALSRAKVAESEIYDYEIELDYDDDTRRWEYEISFNVGRTEYECEINAEDGTILYYQTDIDD